MSHDIRFTTSIDNGDSREFVAKMDVDSTSQLRGARAGDVREFTEFKIKFCWCPRGSFKMGPQDSHVDVELSDGFWIGQTELTRNVWISVMETSSWEGQLNVIKGENFPAAFMNWTEASLFCARLTERDRQSGRLPADWKYDLPTEAQWEYACRAGPKSLYSFGDDVSKLSDFAWFEGNALRVRGQGHTHEVASKPANPWGLYDVHGNVFERCRDTWRAELPGGVNPESRVSSKSRVIRGGGWSYRAAGCTSGSRYGNNLNGRWDNVGLRIARVPSVPRTRATVGQ